MNARRTILGVLAIAMLVLAASIWMVRGYTDTNAFLIGVLARVGILLATVWLAWPILERHAGRLPAILIATLLGLVLFIAIRPRLLPLALAVAVLLLVVHFGLRFLSRTIDH
jgi:hypothetical protein